MDRISSMKLAMENEASEMAFYLNESRRSTNEVAKALFKTLAADEKEHMERIRGLHAKLVSDGSWPKDAPIQVAGTDIRSVLKSIGRDPSQSTAHDLDDILAMKKGIEFEQKGALFYANLADRCDNPQEVRFFKFLAGIEREHMLSIQDSLLYLEDPGSWFESKERRGLDGA